MANPNNWHLGQTSESYESGGSGPGTISSGSGDYGGVSYGTYQLSTNSGTLKEFLNQSAYAENFKNLQPGTKDFNAEWTRLAHSDAGFGQDQSDFIKKTHYDVQAKSLKDDGLDLSGRGPAVQDALWSTSVQFRGLTPTIFEKGLEEKFGKDYKLSSLTDKNIVDSVQDYKINHNESLFKHSPAQWTSLSDRAVNEKMDLEALAEGRSPDPSRHIHTGSTHHHGDQRQSPREQSHVLSQGSQGDSTKRVQGELRDLGYLTAEPDGRFGPTTKAAVERFQRDQDLNPDGKLGPVTQKHLDEAVRDRQILSMASPPSLQLRDFSDPGHPQNALYSTLKEGFPTGASHELLTQATAACYMSGIKKPDDLGNVYGNAEKIMFSSNSPLGSMVVVDVTKPPPSVQQTMQHVQQHDQQQAQMTGQIQAQNAQINQQAAQGPAPGMPGR
jgi:hypothetical protein